MHAVWLPHDSLLPPSRFSMKRIIGCTPRYAFGKPLCETGNPQHSGTSNTSKTHESSTDQANNKQDIACNMHPKPSKPTRHRLGPKQSTNNYTQGHRTFTSGRPCLVTCKVSSRHRQLAHVARRRTRMHGRRVGQRLPM